MNDSAVLGTVIYGYLCWTLGGWQWILPPLLLLLSYNVLTPQDVARDQRPYTVQIVLGVGAIGLFWLILANLTGGTRFYYPFMLSFAAQLAMIGSARHLRAARHIPALLLLARNIIISWVVLFIPFFLIADLGESLWLYAATGLLGITAGAGIFAATQTGPEGYRNNTNRWLLQALSAGLASVLGFAATRLV